MPFAGAHGFSMPVGHPSAPGVCLHCGSAVPAAARDARFCCAGCGAVYGLLHARGLERYYALAGRQVAPVGQEVGRGPGAWLEPLLERATAAQAPGALCSLEVDVQGVRCAACVWLMNELFKREAGGAGITVNPALGKVRLAFRKGALDVAAFLREVEGFGYRFGPPRKASAGFSSDLTWRLGVCAALTINVMLFQVSFYFGLDARDADLFALFSRLSLALTTACVAVGGWPFFQAAWRGLRSGVLHLDLPIAMGISLAFLGSLLQARHGGGDVAYYDTLNTFITLMLLGRWLQQRVLERNRRYLLDDDGAEGVCVRRRAGDRLEVVPAARVGRGDALVVAPGEVVPVDARLDAESGVVSLDWITGESAPRRLERGAAVPAGSINAGDAALPLTAQQDFAESPLVALLRQTASGQGGVPLHARFWAHRSRLWVLGVLSAATAGFLLWLPAGAHRALDVTVALLVVTCPCAIGIAVPLAYELTWARLRRHGFFGRVSDLLDRLVRVRRVVFDKTGTLTLGRLTLGEPAAAQALPPALRELAYNLACRSSHPASRAIADVLADAGARFQPDAAVAEVPGQGLRWVRPDGEWRLGRRAWAAPGTAGPEPVLACGGAERAAFPLAEALRADAPKELAALQARGLELWLLSGDAPARVEATARGLGFAEGRALGGLSPQDKAALVARTDRQDTLYVGDGVNDALAFQAALCAGTPAVDRPVMPGRSDFFLTGEGLQPLRLALAEAFRLRRAVQGLLAVSLAWNVLVVAACLAGWMTPLRAAVAMPLSSLALILWTTARLGPDDAVPARSAPRLLEVRP